MVFFTSLLINFLFTFPYTVLVHYRSLIHIQILEEVFYSNKKCNSFYYLFLYKFSIYRAITFFGIFFQKFNLIYIFFYLFHFRSPLLTKSFLFSFPSITKMFSIHRVFIFMLLHQGSYRSQFNSLQLSSQTPFLLMARNPLNVFLFFINKIFTTLSLSASNGT